MSALLRRQDEGGETREVKGETLARFIIPDYVRFIMPKDRELQWAAMPIVQKWINNYQIRMEKGDVSGGRAQFQLTYDLEMADEDFEIFKRAGLVLKQEPEKFDVPPDMIVDYSDERLKRFENQGRYVTQVCGIFCGEEAPSVPTVKKVHPGLGARWATLDEEWSTRDWYGWGMAELITAEDLLEAKDAQWMGVIGRASWQTYLAASMMLPVIEIIPATRNKKWLSKFYNIGYRVVVDDGDGEQLVDHIRQAIKSVEVLLCSRAQAEVVAK